MTKSFQRDSSGVTEQTEHVETFQCDLNGKKAKVFGQGHHYEAERSLLVRTASVPRTQSVDAHNVPQQTRNIDIMRDTGAEGHDLCTKGPKSDLNGC